MAKITLPSITSGFYSTTALNQAFTDIEAAIENTVSRDGTAPNNMSGDLDMNSNRITNLPEPVNLNEVARLQDVVNGIAGASTANLVSFTPYSTIAATTVQGAIQEVVDETQPLDATLTALAGTLTAANKVPYATALNTAAELDFLDEDDLSSNSASALASQQSIRAYADTKNIAIQVVPTTAGNVLFTSDGTTWSSAAKIVSGTTIATTAGTSHDFTSIPAWVKRITVMFSGVSTNGTSVPIIQLGDAGGIEATGYLSSASAVSTGVASTNYTTGFGLLASIVATTVFHGSCTISLLNAATNLWAISGAIGRSDSAASAFFGGSKALTAALTQIRLTTVNGTDLFDAGSINIHYE